MVEKVGTSILLIYTIIFNLHVKFHQNRLILKIGYGVSTEILEEKNISEKDKLCNFAKFCTSVYPEPYNLGR